MLNNSSKSIIPMGVIGFFGFKDILTYDSNTKNYIKVTKLQIILDFRNKIDIIDI